MEFLAVYRKALKDEASVSALLSGDVWIERVDQGDAYPNILLESPEEGQDYTHSGPSTLIDAHLVVTCRAPIRADVIALGEAVRKFLQDYKGTEYGITIQLTEHFKTSGGYDDKMEAFFHRSEYTAFFNN